jgi:hypothetical protein
MCMIRLFWRRVSQRKTAGDSLYCSAAHVAVYGVSVLVMGVL